MFHRRRCAAAGGEHGHSHPPGEDRAPQKRKRSGGDARFAESFSANARLEQSNPRHVLSAFFAPDPRFNSKRIGGRTKRKDTPDPQPGPLELLLEHHALRRRLDEGPARGQHLFLPCRCDLNTAVRDRPATFRRVRRIQRAPLPCTLGRGKDYRRAVLIRQRDWIILANQPSDRSESKQRQRD